MWLGEFKRQPILVYVCDFSITELRARGDAARKLPNKEWRIIESQQRQSEWLRMARPDKRNKRSAGFGSVQSVRE